ncbi:MAG: phosphatidylserine/phosphatidylglycerophosphate/cardiolipin synthase family protein [Acidobacteriota bacterium]
MTETSLLATPEFEKEIDRLTGTVVRRGNTVVLMPSGVQSYQKRWELIARAESTVHIVAFSIMRDDTSRQLRDVVRERLRAGAEARLILDDFSLYTTFAFGIIRDMEKAGAHVVTYNETFRNLLPVWSQNHRIRQFVRAIKFKQKRRFHEKYLIVDGRQAILGGLNWGTKYAFGGVQPKAWRDTDVYLEGPVVADIQSQFVRDFFLYSAMNRDKGRRLLGAPLDCYFEEAKRQEGAFRKERGSAAFPKLGTAGSAPIRYVPHKPYDEGRLRITEAYLRMFRAAKRNIFWGCHGIRPPRLIAETLADAVERGVEVRLITNSKRSARTLVLFGLLGWMYWESRNHYHWLLDHGIRIFEWQRAGAFHSKNLVIDGAVASVGSYNVARGSTFHHTEGNVIVYDRDFAGQVEAQFEEDLKDCVEVRKEDRQGAAPSYFFDPFQRLLHERNQLVDPTLLPRGVREDLERGRIKYM